MSDNLKADVLQLQFNNMFGGTVDPTAGAGQAAPEGSLYLRFVSGVGEVWQKVGTLDTEWEMLTTGPHNTLTGAYNEGGPGIGRQIDKDAGAVAIVDTDATLTNNTLELSEDNVARSGDMISAAREALATGRTALFQHNGVQTGPSVDQVGCELATNNTAASGNRTSPMQVFKCLSDGDVVSDMPHTMNVLLIPFKNTELPADSASRLGFWSNINGAGFNENVRIHSDVGQQPALTVRNGGAGQPVFGFFVDDNVSGTTPGLTTGLYSGGAGIWAWHAGGAERWRMSTTVPLRISQPGGIIEFDSGDAGGNDPNVRAGTADPSAGGGVAAPEGSIYLRFVTGVGEIWLKTAAAATAWTQIPTSAPAAAKGWASVMGANAAAVSGTSLYELANGAGGQVTQWVMPQSGSARYLAMSTVSGGARTAGEVGSWVQKSTDGGATWSDWWGLAAAMPVTLDAVNTRVDTASSPSGTLTFAAGDKIRLFFEEDGSWAQSGGAGIECTLVCELD